MITLAEKSNVIQNVGLIDRMLRLLVGVALLGFAYYEAVYGDLMPTAWNSYVWGISIYPLMTGIIGWDPLYALIYGQTCNAAGRNQCGTLPYQVKAMVGRGAKFCDTDSEHSLEACHDDPVEHPHHKLWKVDQEPMLYPDDAAWKEYFRKHPVTGKK